jgi:hypothetical protein
LTISRQTVVSLFLAWGLRRRSRTAGVLGALLYGINVLVAYDDVGRVRHRIAAIINFFILIAFIHGVRGVFACHRLSQHTLEGRPL